MRAVRVDHWVYGNSNRKEKKVRDHRSEEEVHLNCMDLVEADTTQN